MVDVQRVADFFSFYFLLSGVSMDNSIMRKANKSRVLRAFPMEKWISCRYSSSWKKYDQE
jgi:hypothetical protein